MRKVSLLAIVGLALGCSTGPFHDCLDFFHPAAKIKPGMAQGRGGVCAPTPLAGTAPPAPAANAPVVPADAPGGAGLPPTEPPLPQR